MKSLGYVHTPIADHHRWSRPSRRSIATGKGSLNRTTRLMLHQMRWRKPPRQYGLSVLAWTLSMLLHLLAMTAMLLLRPPLSYIPPPPGQENAIQVRFIDASAPAPPPPVVPQRASVTKRVAKGKRAVKRSHVAYVQAPNLAPIAVPAPVHRNIEVRVTRRPAGIGGKQPPPLQLQSPPASLLPVPEVPLPKVVMEPSKMALPPPKVTLTQQTSVPLPAPLEQPVQWQRLQSPVQGTAKPEVQAASAAGVTVQPLETPKAALPPLQVESMEKLRVETHVTVPPVALVEATPSSAQQTPQQAKPVTPIQASEVRIGVSVGKPQVAVSAPVIEPQPTIEVASGTHPSIVAATHIPSAVSLPSASTVVAPVPSKQPSWAPPSDRFSNKRAIEPGRGTAMQRQAGKGRSNGVPKYIQRPLQGNSDVMTRRFHGLDYKPTIFNQYWTPDNQNALTGLLQELVDVLSYNKTLDLGHGVRIHCGGWLLGFGCIGDPPSAPSAKSTDQRLNMAPAQPLVPDVGASAAAPTAPVALPKSSLQSVECETARVSGAPLPVVCNAPKDTHRGWR